MRRNQLPVLQIEPIAVAAFLGWLLTERSATVLALFLAVAAHEAGHLFLARLLNIRVEKIRFGLLGARIKISGVQSYQREGMLAFAGPAASLLCAAAAGPFASIDFFGRFCALSLILGMLNLLPVKTFDGGRLLFCLLAGKFGGPAAERILQGFSFGFLLLLWCFSVYLLLRAGGGISWLGFSASLLVCFFDGNLGKM